MRGINSFASYDERPTSPKPGPPTPKPTHQASGN